MSPSCRLALLGLGTGWVLAGAGAASARQVYGPTEFGMSDGSAPESMLEARPCEEGAQEDGTIVVCRELEDPERYMSVLPRAVEVHVNQLDGLREPPCWVTGRWPCGRVGYAPPPIYLIDLDAIPEALTDAEAAQVMRAEDMSRLNRKAPTSRAGASPAALPPGWANRRAR